MNQITSRLRGFANMLISGILLMIAVVNFNATLELTKGANTLNISTDNALSLLIYLALVLITGLLAWAFWHQRTASNSLFVSAALNGLACALLVAAVIYGVLAK